MVSAGQLLQLMHTVADSPGLLGAVARLPETPVPTASAHTCGRCVFASVRKDPVFPACHPHCKDGHPGGNEKLMCLPAHLWTPGHADEF